MEAKSKCIARHTMELQSHFADRTADMEVRAIYFAKSGMATHNVLSISTLKAKTDNLEALVL
jgi:hypothetical protein